MAFINITDPNRREEIVQEYLQMRNEVRKANENNKEGNLLKEKEIEERSKPIVAATEKSAEKITSAIKKNDTPSTSFEFYRSMTKNKDKYFSIYRVNAGTFKLGNTDIRIDENNNISISEKTYEYSPGLWDLLMLNKLDENDYTDEDLENYKAIVELTDLINNPHIIASKTAYTSTAKYKFLVRLISNKRKRIRTEEDEEESDEDTLEEASKVPLPSTPKKKGTGIILPGDINGLKRRLQIVCGERDAGNIEATTPEIVAILDELLRRNYISKKEYNVLCKKLEC